MRVIFQTEAAECGLAAVAMIAQHHGHNVDLIGLRQRFKFSLKGATLRDLMNIADALGLGSRALRLEVDGLKDLQTPAILHWNMGHFVVLESIQRKKYRILDPGRGEVVMSAAEISKHFTGVALELAPTTEFKPIVARSRTRLTSLWSKLSGLKRSFGQILILSLIMQIFVLATPFYVQLAVDHAIVQFDKEFLLVLAVAFLFLYLINAVTQLLRSWVILILGQSLSFQMIGNVLRHLIRLPAEFFEKRHIGDIISRIEATQPIRNALTQQVVAGLIDGAMAVTTVILMFVYSWKLALVSIGVTTVHILAALVIFPLMRTRQEDLIAKMARERSSVLETLRASRAIKLFGRETEREASWRNLYVDFMNAARAAGRLEIGNKFAQNVLTGVDTVFVVYIVALAVLNNEMTIGMLFAFLSYRQNFSDRATALVEKGIEFRMLGLHLDRLSDIVQAKQEESLDVSLVAGKEIRGELELQGASFRYADNEPYVFEDLSFKIEAGEFIAIAGPSGGGKTTLMKVLLGLLVPERGEVRIDGQRLSTFGLRNWRAQARVVMQDDQLLSGTIAENISFFDPMMDMDRIQECSVEAHIHEDIIRMPMNYSSLIGDMGAALSGGQRQRLLLARALYRKPKVLFLDEGTANLDEFTERKIAEVISHMPITRVVVAHRPELIRRADRVFDMFGGRLVQREGRGSQPLTNDKLLPPCEEVSVRK